MYKSIILLAISLACVFAHGDHAEMRMTRELVAQHRAFRSACSASASCVLQKEVTEGPYYYNTALVRQDITEGKTGIPLTFKFTVVDVNTCAVIPNAAVDLWHCDSTGTYSHYQNANNNGGATTTFLRGLQLADSTGVATFTTILPGWYTGRAIHFHIKVHIGGTSSTGSFTGGSVVHTGQAFFNESFMQSYKVLSPYSSSTQQYTALASDSIYQGATDIAIASVVVNDATAGISGGVTATLTLGVDQTSSTTTASSTANTNSATRTLFSFVALALSLVAMMI